MTQEKSKDHIDQLFTRLDDLPKSANVNAVFGLPTTMGDKTVIPIANVSYAFGLGFGQDQEEASSDTGAGGGAGALAKPVGLAEITPERTHIEPIVDEQTVALAGIALAAWSVFWIARALIKILRR
jgi:uncharacterized spore protein YtfJ